MKFPETNVEPLNRTISGLRSDAVNVNQIFAIILSTEFSRILDIYNSRVINY